MPKYRTTRPLIPSTADRKAVEASVNDHLTIQLRPYEPTDLPYVHRLRTQANVMVNTSTGVVDPDLEASRIWMDRKLPPNDKTLDFAIWAKENDEPWEHIGIMGCHKMEPVPHLGYMIREEWWGKSIVTNAVRMLLQVWWALERKTVDLSTESAQDEHDLHLIMLEMDQSDLAENVEIIDEDGCKVVPEILLAEIEEHNIGSLRVIERSGFKYRDRESIVEDVGTFVLLDFTISPPR